MNFQDAELRAVQPPTQCWISGAGQRGSLVHELRWYLEQFLEWPFHPDTDRATRTIDALRDWGERAFTTLFPRGLAAPGRLSLASADPTLLAYPWEALSEPGGGWIGPRVAIERVLLGSGPSAPERDLPCGELNVMLVTCRPAGERDVGFNAIARPMVEAFTVLGYSVHVHVLRPPTFEALRAHLAGRPNFYHVFHFDGHGKHGVLVFEDEHGNPTPRTGAVVGKILVDAGVPIVTLNACQSGISELDPDTSVSTALLRAGVPQAVAMSHSVRVGGAREFVPAFYRTLCETGDVCQATLAGRGQMYARPGRTSPVGQTPLHDWLLPVSYRREASVQRRLVRVAARPSDDRSRTVCSPEGLPPPARFVGRDAVVLALERGLGQKRPVIVLHGLGGAGKTSVAAHFVRWLAETHGLPSFWTSFQGVSSVDEALRAPGHALVGDPFARLGRDAQIDAVGRALVGRPALLVWDNFESSAGWNAEERGRLCRFLDSLRGARAKVLVTSRSEERSLASYGHPIALTGLEPEEQWELCDQIIGEQGLDVDRHDEALVKLLQRLGGHPLAMRAVLSLLKRFGSTAALRDRLDEIVSALDEADPIQRHLSATLAVVLDGTPAGLEPTLGLIALHEETLRSDTLIEMARRIEPAPSDERVHDMLLGLANAGLLQRSAESTFRVHPILGTYLRSRRGSSDGVACQDTFAQVLAAGAEAEVTGPSHAQAFTGSMHTNLVAAATLPGVGAETRFSLCKCLGTFAYNRRRLGEAELWYRRALGIAERTNDRKKTAKICHNLGVVAQVQCRYELAEQWSRRSQALEESLGDEDGMAVSYQQLGRIAQEQRELVRAAEWYQKSLEIKLRRGNERGAAFSLHQLGMVAQEQRDFTTAEANYHRSREIRERLNDEQNAAVTYQQIGRVHEERGDLDSAEQWYRKSLASKLSRGDENGASYSYHQLGLVAEARGRLKDAEGLLRSSLLITERSGNDSLAALSSHHLGRVSARYGDISAAEEWYRRSMEIERRLGNAHGEAVTRYELGNLARGQGREDEGIECMLSALTVFLRTDPPRAAALADELRDIYAELPGVRRSGFRKLWTAAVPTTPEWLDGPDADMEAI